MEPKPVKKKSKAVLIWLALAAILILATVVMFKAFAGWTVPDSARKMQNPYPATAEALQDAGAIYTKRCKECHGVNGDGTGEKADQLSAMPSDFTDAREMGRATDGELFWKITHGRRPMPAFKDKLTDKQRWELVDYIRTFAKKAAAQNGAAQ
ncbi:MAG: c-type cytochrome [Candidatus Acidiferrales bacterium]